VSFSARPVTHSSLDRHVLARDAAVTVAAHDAHMSTDPRNGSAGREGALILRVWLEERDDSALRIRMIGRLDLDSDDEDSAAAATIEEALAHIRAWLVRFAASGDGEPRS